MSGFHIEYYSYSFYIKYLFKKVFPPFIKTDYYPVSGEDEIPCASIENWKYLGNSYVIYIFGFDSKNLELHVDITNEGTLSQYVIDILLRNNFTLSEYGYSLNISVEFCFERIKLLCDEFIKLSMES